MFTEIYLDTARLGRMCPGARGAEQDFLKLVSRLGSSLYFERFLVHGHQALPARLRRRLPRLACWHGVKGLSNQFAIAIDQPPECPAYFFGQSHSFIRFAVESLCRRARTILTSDLEWPPYLEMLHAMAEELGCRMVIVPLQEMVQREGASHVEVLERLQREFAACDCDGVFLSDITYLGIRLPIVDFCRWIDPTSAYVVIDGAQAFGQRDVSLRDISCDLYLVGTQKWLRAYHPLRVALVGRRRDATLTEFPLSHELYDPLYEFHSAVLADTFSGFGETVNVAGFITAAGALARVLRKQSVIARAWRRRQANAVALGGWLKGSGWGTSRLNSSLASGTLIATPRFEFHEPPSRLRQELQCRGIVASVFPGGVVRLAMPGYEMPLRYVTHIAHAFMRLHDLLI